MTRKQCIGYKVVIVKQQKFMSVVYDDDVASVEYKLNTKSRPRPNNGPLCVFSDMANAKFFFDYDMISGRGNILKVRYKPSYENRVWTTVVNRKYSVPILYLPRGTVLADTVTPFEVIE